LIAKDLSFCIEGFHYLANNSQALFTNDSQAPFAVSEPREEQARLPVFLAKSVWFASVTTYGKCFASANGRGQILKAADVEPFGDALYGCHKKLIEDRNQYVVHGGSSLNEHSQFAIAVESVEPRQVRSVLPFIHTALPGREIISAAGDLCRRLAAVVEDRLNTACDSLEAEVRAMPADKLRQILARAQDSGSPP